MDSFTIPNCVVDPRGCALDRWTNNLYVAQYSRGNVVRLNLMPESRDRIARGDTLPSSAAIALLEDSSEFHLRYGTTEAGEHYIAPLTHHLHSTDIAQLSNVDYWKISATHLYNQTYGNEPITVAPGAVIAVRIFRFNPPELLLARFRVVTCGTSIQFTYRVFEPDFEPTIVGRGFSGPLDILITGSAHHSEICILDNGPLKNDWSLYGSTFDSVHPPVSGSPFDRSNMRRYLTSGWPSEQVAHNPNTRTFYMFEGDSMRSSPACKLVGFTGSDTTLVVDLGKRDPSIGPRGLIVRSDENEAFFSYDQHIYRVDLGSKHVELASTVRQPGQLAWADDAESGLFATRAGQIVSHIDLKTGTSSRERLIFYHLPKGPRGITRHGSRMFVSSDTDGMITDFRMDSLPVKEPLLMGIGHIPASKIEQGARSAFKGYADTTADPKFFLQVGVAPFGGKLAVMFNHLRARTEGANWYRVFVDGNRINQGFTDYRWNSSGKRFQLVTTSPSANGYYPVRKPADLWMEPNLGYRLDTTHIPDGTRLISLETYSDRRNNLVGRDSLYLQIDNKRPIARVEEILHCRDRREIPIEACGLARADPAEFKFIVTAHDPAGHLLSWYLVSWWAEDKEKSVKKVVYNPSWRGWKGPLRERFPKRAAWNAAVAGDPSSTRCAHTFYLEVWDRTIDGCKYIHKATAHKSMTIYLEP